MKQRLCWHERFDSFGAAASWFERTLPEAVEQENVRLRHAGIAYDYEFDEAKGYWVAHIDLIEVVYIGHD